MTSIWAYGSGHGDFCETNFAWTPYIAEFWNAVSSLAMAAIAVHGMAAASRARLELWVQLLFASLLVVGLGSTWFHATLSFAGQMADQLPMLLVAVGLLYAVVVADATLPPALVRATPALLALFSGGLAAYVLLVAASPVVFRVSFAGVLLVIIAQQVRLATRHGPWRLKRVYLKALGCFAVAVTVWVVDQKLCGHLQRLPANPQLHAYWHVLCALACYNVFNWLAFIRQRELKKEPRLEEGWAVVQVV